MKFRAMQVDSIKGDRDGYDGYYVTVEVLMSKEQRKQLLLECIDGMADHDVHTWLKEIWPGYEPKDDVSYD